MHKILKISGETSAFIEESNLKYIYNKSQTKIPINKLKVMQKTLLKMIPRLHQHLEVKI